MRQFLWFCVVGGSGIAVNLAVFEAVWWLAGRQAGWPTSLAAIAGWTVAVASNFALHQRLTFRSEAATALDPLWHRLGRYYLSVLLGLGLQLSVMHALLTWAVPALPDLARWGGWPVRLANVAGIGTGTIANFWMARRFVFRPSNKDER